GGPGVRTRGRMAACSRGNVGPRRGPAHRWLWPEADRTGRTRRRSSFDRDLYQDEVALQRRVAVDERFAVVGRRIPCPRSIDRRELQYDRRRGPLALQDLLFSAAYQVATAVPFDRVRREAPIRIQRLAGLRPHPRRDVGAHFAAFLSA